jgi:tetratricopeptide (TPR) repeat protein
MVEGPALTGAAIATSNVARAHVRRRQPRRRDLGTLLLSAGKPSEARDQLERALAIQRQSLPSRHPDLIETLEALGALAREQHRLDDAARYLEEARDISEFRFGVRHLDLA